MTTFTLATIIACATIVVLTVLIIWLRQAKKAKLRPYHKDMYAKVAETIVNVEKPFVGRGVRRVIGKDPTLGYGYGTKGRDDADILGALVHPSLGFGMDELDHRAQQAVEGPIHNFKDCQFERNPDVGILYSGPPITGITITGDVRGFDMRAPVAYDNVEVLADGTIIPRPPVKADE